MRWTALAAAAALSMSLAMPAGAAGVTVLRGGAPQTANGHITILRGTPALAEVRAPEAAPPAVTAVAGGTLLWLIDADGQVKACGVRGSGRVGGPDIVHCSAGPLVR